MFIHIILATKIMQQLSCRFDKSLKSYSVISVKIYNALKPMIDLHPFNKFKRLLFEWLMENPFYSLDEFFDLSKISF